MPDAQRRLLCPSGRLDRRQTACGRGEPTEVTTAPSGEQRARLGTAPDEELLFDAAAGARTSGTFVVPEDGYLIRDDTEAPSSLEPPPEPGTTIEVSVFDHGSDEWEIAFVTERRR